MMRRLIACLLVVSTLATSLPLQAAMLATDADRQRISAALERDGMSEQLAAFGIGIEEARARIAALSDGEAAELAGRIDALPAGGLDVLAVALVVFLILLLTDILGYTSIFPFTKPARN